jgi:hypothetical protein
VDCVCEVDVLRASSVEQAPTIQGVADLVMATFALPHWQVVSVIVQPAARTAVCKQEKAHVGIIVISSAMVREQTTEAKMAVRVKYGTFMIAVCELID